jgi:hypothetical protein
VVLSAIVVERNRFRLNRDFARSNGVLRPRRSDTRVRRCALDLDVGGSDRRKVRIDRFDEIKIS